jgi:hypothetical protein
VYQSAFLAVAGTAKSVKLRATPRNVFITNTPGGSIPTMPLQQSHHGRVELKTQSPFGITGVSPLKGTVHVIPVARAARVYMTARRQAFLIWLALMASVFATATIISTVCPSCVSQLEATCR